MLIVLTSPHAVAPLGAPKLDVVAALIAATTKGHPVAIVSNHAEPKWFQGAFGGSNVQFLQAPGRQNGQVVTVNVEQFGVRPHDAVVLLGKAEDIMMAKNGGALMLAAGWVNDKQVKGLGVQVQDGKELLEVLDLTDKWSGAWWFSGNGGAGGYSVRALADLSSMYWQPDAQQIFAGKLKTTVKNGGARLTALLTVTARSLLTEGLGVSRESLWGIYPSSSSKNNDSDVLSDFVHRLRTVTSRVRFAERGQPLFIRHTPSAKRSSGAGGNRMDPSGQVETLHINPHYKKGRLVGRDVILLDDCTTYGVSFGVAAALLRKAGAASVTGVALGKFGNRLASYRIDINSDPFSHVKKASYMAHPPLPLLGVNNEAAKTMLQSLIP
ncbi:hypothetical protein [Aromatoleum buckelii]|uniref:Phosphoribosyltransferase n=1 Tax=Aromatoleum buckelii TaxID=200254 RepID=A0ABX1N1H0_9RHOO|nr:hypothetical protein [Aromatoleum buckelii]MCK0510241.1 hypothetical protein [Aromatoleum buckelii]